MNLFFFEAEGFLPHHNQATELALVQSLPEHSAALYLWRNRRTVVVGRNQDCFAECRVAELEADGGCLARRVSGGGAVYHDRNNLNFSFIMPMQTYDVARQLGVVMRAVRGFGVNAQMSGRNDLEADDAKFSGNAFYRTKDVGLHHGTLLIDTDIALLERYLVPDADKLKRRGVSSVRSRVVNLSQLAAVDARSLSDALRLEFAKEYGSAAVRDGLTLDSGLLQKNTARFSAPEWLYGNGCRPDRRYYKRFSWGSLTAVLELSGGVVSQCGIYSDSLEYDVFLSMSKALCGAKFKPNAVKCALLAVSAESAQQKIIVADTADMLCSEAACG